MKSNLAISISGLSKVYRLYGSHMDRLRETLNPFSKKMHRDFYALRNLDLTISKGEVVGVIGKNGCGKSTLLKIISGVLTPSSGHVDTLGRVSALLELGAGFNPEMTGIENIYLNGTLRGLTRGEIEGHLTDILEFADIGDFVYQPVKVYSSGMFARLAFSLAINVDPDVLIVDEILSVGDIAFQRKCFAQMERFKDEGKTIIFVSHIASSLVELCDRAVFLHEGNLVLDGDPKLVTNLYAKYSGTEFSDINQIRQEFEELLAGESNDTATDTVGVGYKDESSAYLDHSIATKSKVVFEENGAVISNPKFTTPSGREVNVLVQGEVYFYSYEVDFLDDLSSVQYGMMIKTANGVELSGAAFPSKTEFIARERKGKKTVRWKISMCLNDGTYFVNSGVMANFGERIEYAHRILDLFVFKVIKADEGSTGYFKLIDSDTYNPS